ncbi:nucleoside ABC transporter membrane protein [Thermanaeromonas toyohensis ToBE]|uniref:Nucleoside ABC transporter membrane protein n=1 Tax=Thermanaeromonas toyohensis ToBE TaxID=698762 RepID=A0A1W1VFA1_9FIRM|nr:ABC transporter permease [Thermanaeromonas toyohensis]SMB92089.1 nucleoside ABC transporter membrane protein [Thermanaeromonas toyohensis ToBE]
MEVKWGKWMLKVERKPRLKGTVPALIGPLVALSLALAVSSLVIALSKVNPLVAYQYMFYGAFGSVRSFTETLVKTTPLLLCGLGLTIAYRTGLISVGAEGQMIIGGLFTTLAGLYMGWLPGFLLLPVLMLAGLIGGGLWGAIPGYLKARLGVSEVINTIMLNYIAYYLVAYLLDVPLREPPGYFPQSAQIARQGWLPYLLPGTRLHLGVIIAFLSCFIVYFILWRSPLGYQMRAVGYNREAARHSGINVEKNMVLAFTLSGAFAGLAGMVEIAGLHHRLLGGFSSEYGFDAMAVALLGKLHPAGVAIAALFFGALRVGANMMQRSVQVPASLVFVIQGLVILFVLMDELLRNYVIRFLKPYVEEESHGA